MPKSQKIGILRDVAVHVAVSPYLRRKLKILAERRALTLNELCVKIFEVNVEDVKDLEDSNSKVKKI